jgi:DNA invertase Pin-like site-specific DNA recombinase
MKRFAFYGRVSTEDQQDPESSKAWQLARATQLISLEGEVVVEYFDIGQSRSLPWKRRPESARLLADLKRADRGFDAVVIGEPARAFYGNQFGLTFPVLTHYDVELWVPEVGGAVDPGSDAHDLVMALYGGMSKGERNRIKIRVRSAMATQAAEGRFLGGRPPYGYRLADGGPHPNPGKAANGHRLHYLDPDPSTAPIVERIYDEYLNGSGIYMIAEGLTRDGVPCPSAADPKRNSHRTGIAWSKSAVRSILRNPRYTGREVWNKQRRDETLIDVEDVALGHETKLRWNDVDEWIWPTETTHDPIIDPEAFARAQQQAGAGAQRATRRVNRRKNTYALRGLLRCAACGARMQGNWNHDRAHYRCRVPAEYALANKVDHPPTIYLREDHVLPALDNWIASVFDPANIDDTIAALTEAQAPSEADDSRIEAARRALDEANEKIDRLVTAIESGSPADMLGPRLQELRAAKLAAERHLQAARPRDLVDESRIRALIDAVGPIADVLADADPEAKARLYNELGLELTFDAAKRLVQVEALPVCVRSCRRGDLNAALSGDAASQCVRVRAGQSRFSSDRRANGSHPVPARTTPFPGLSRTE